MSKMNPLEPIPIPPPCPIRGCPHGLQLAEKFKVNGTYQYLKTCARHTYKDIP